MATERSDQVDVETSPQPEEETQPQASAAEGAHSVPQGRAWYRAVSEDWLATVVGLVLVILVVVRLFHAIP